MNWLLHVMGKPFTLILMSKCCTSRVWSFFWQVINQNVKRSPPTQHPVGVLSWLGEWTQQILIFYLWEKMEKLRTAVAALCFENLRKNDNNWLILPSNSMPKHLQTASFSSSLMIVVTGQTFLKLKLLQKQKSSFEVIAQWLFSTGLSYS